MDGELNDFYAKFFCSATGEFEISEQLLNEYYHLASGGDVETFYIFAPLAFFLAGKQMWSEVCLVFERCLVLESKDAQENTYSSWLTIGNLLAESSGLEQPERMRIRQEALQIALRTIELFPSNPGFLFDAANLCRLGGSVDDIASGVEYLRRAELLALEIGDQDCAEGARWLRQSWGVGD